MEDRDRIQEDFERFHLEHPVVYNLFNYFATKMLARGFDRGSAKLIFERIRWELSVEVRTMMSPKLNNNYTSRYARLWEEKNPAHRGFFRKRKLSPVSANSTSKTDPIWEE